MRLFTRHFFSFKFTLLVLIIISLIVTFSHGARKQRNNNNYHIIHFGSFPSKPNCSAHHKPGLETHKMKLSHGYGPCSAFANSVEVSLSEIIAKNEGRVRWLNRRISKSKSHTTTTTGMGESIGKSYKPVTSQVGGGAGKSLHFSTSKEMGNGGEYIATIGLGTPMGLYKVMIDTGSDPTWVRCKTSTSPFFDPSKSSTYRNASKEFNENYADGSSSKGYWASDYLTIENNVIKNFLFGCAQLNEDDGDDFGHADGVLGLGRGSDSLVSQSGTSTFGYCLPTNSDDGYWFFGDEAGRISSSSTLQFTELEEVRDNGRYWYLQLVDISVAGNRLNTPSDVLESGSGTIIDSGTVLTHLPGEVYQVLSSAFKQSMFAYQSASNQGVLDTCFFVRSDQKSIKFPSVTFHFADGTDVDLDQYGIGLRVKENIWCLAFTKKQEGVNIIGNTQQRGMVVVYDNEAGKVGFGKQSCGF